MVTGLATRWLIRIAAVAAMAVAVGPAVGGEPAIHRPRLEQSGRSITIEDGVATALPIYTIAIGEVGRAEADALAWTARFGPHGLDATIWAPEGDRVGRWVMVVYRRPASAAEAVRFVDGPEAFENRQLGGAELLPHPLTRLTAEQCARIDYVARYRAGGTRIGLAVGTTAAEAETMILVLAAALIDAGYGSHPLAAP